MLTHATDESFLLARGPTCSSSGGSSNRDPWRSLLCNGLLHHRHYVRPRRLLADASLRLVYDPPQLSCHAIQHRALLLHPLAVIVDLAGNGWHDLLDFLAAWSRLLFRRAPKRTISRAGGPLVSISEPKAYDFVSCSRTGVGSFRGRRPKATYAGACSSTEDNRAGLWRPLFSFL